MPTKLWFPTLIYSESVKKGGVESLNRELLSESGRIAENDRAGRKWSEKNYPGGYTSYGSLAQLHKMSSTFDRLRKMIDAHVARFAKQLDFDLREHKLEMTSCWVNIVPQHTYHGLHLHPISTLSGTYYVRVPKGSGAIKFEDPRLSSLMAHPPRKASVRDSNRNFVQYEPKEGQVLLWESWLRHEVLQNRTEHDRVSISFNYNWF